MKIFAQESINIEEISNAMELNIVKNASSKRQIENTYHVDALTCLAEAAELFEKAKDFAKAEKITEVLKQISVNASIRENDIKNNLHLLEVASNKLLSLNGLKEIDQYIVNTAKNKVNYTISKIANINDSLSDNIYNLKNSYKLTPKTLYIIKEATNVINSVLTVIGQDCAAEVSDDGLHEEDLLDTLPVLNNLDDVLEFFKNKDKNKDDDKEEYWED